MPIVVIHPKQLLNGMQGNRPKVQYRFVVNEGFRMLAAAQIPQRLFLLLAQAQAEKQITPLQLTLLTYLPLALVFLK